MTPRLTVAVENEMLAPVFQNLNGMATANAYARKWTQEYETYGLIT